MLFMYKNVVLRNEFMNIFIKNTSHRFIFKYAENIHISIYFKLLAKLTYVCTHMYI